MVSHITHEFLYCAYCLAINYTIWLKNPLPFLLCKVFIDKKARQNYLYDSIQTIYHFLLPECKHHSIHVTNATEIGSRQHDT